ncbi:MAG TPA: Uma2 family endonuclease [Thermoanaerobaculia bacterium]
MYNPVMAVHYETETPPAPRSMLGPYRDADYVALPDEPRCELLYGSLFVTPAPSLRHQDVVFRLARLLVDHADRVGDKAFVSPVDVALADHSVVQPDVVYVKAEHGEILRRRVEGTPDLVVEVLSPGTARRDLGEKLRLYAESGIAEYWLVDPEGRTFEFLVLRDGAYTVLLPADGLYRSPAVASLEVDPEAFWRSVRL